MTGCQRWRMVLFFWIGTPWKTFRFQAAHGGHVDVYGPSCHQGLWCFPCFSCSQGPCGCLRPVFPLKVMSISVGPVVAGGYMMVSVIHVAAQGHVMSLVCAPAVSYVDVYGLCYLLKSCWCPWLMLPLVVLLSVACAATEGHDGVCVPCFRELCCLWLWSVLPPETIWKLMIHCCVNSNWS